MNKKDPEKEEFMNELRWYLEYNLGVSMEDVYAIPSQLDEIGYVDKMETPEQVVWFLEETREGYALDEETMNEIVDGGNDNNE